MLQSLNNVMPFVATSQLERRVMAKTRREPALYFVDAQRARCQDVQRKLASTFTR
jgi:hypothetical protein